MKKIIFAIIIATSLAACGAGASENSQGFTIVVAGQTSHVEGLGASQIDREYDAVAYTLSQFKPGSPERLAMQSPRGLLVLVNGKRYIVTERNDGFHIQAA